MAYGTTDSPFLKVRNNANSTITQIEDFADLRNGLNAVEQNILNRINVASKDGEEAKKLFGIYKMDEEQKAMSLQKSKLVSCVLENEYPMG